MIVQISFKSFPCPHHGVAMLYLLFILEPVDDVIVQDEIALLPFLLQKPLHLWRCHGDLTCCQTTRFFQRGFLPSLSDD